MQSALLTKSYDLRGIFGKDIITEDYFLLARAFVSVFQAKTVIIGYDARVSSKTLRDAFVRGVQSSGAKAVDIGLCSTDMLQFASCSDDADIAVMITASHNPKEYNGLKSCQKNAKPINLKEWGKALSDAMEQDLARGTQDDTNKEYPKDTLESRNILDAWVDHVASFADGETFSGMKIVADAGNGTAGVFMKPLSEKLGFELVPLFFEPDGNFPNHHPSPIESKNTIDMVKKVHETHADLGVAFDGDADRAVLCDETGALISASTLCVAIAESTLRKHPGATIVGNAVISKSVQKMTESHGGKYERSMVWHVYIKEMMSKDTAIQFAGEHSGHYYFRENANADSGAIAFVHFLVAMKLYHKRASELKKEFDFYSAIEETNFEIAEPKAVIDAIEKIFKKNSEVTHIERFDGLTVEFDFGWFNLRPSSNEPLVRLNMEADSPQSLELLKALVFPHLQ